MKRRSVTFERWDVLAVPFPFTERQGAKRRPALVLSNSSFNGAGHLVLAMITTSTRVPWPGDTELRDHSAAGLPRPCVVRLKLFTLDARLIIRKVGALSTADRRSVEQNLRRFLT